MLDTYYKTLLQKIISFIEEQRRWHKVDVHSHFLCAVEHRTREHSVSSHYRLWLRIPHWPPKIIDSLSAETLNRGPM